MENKYAHSDFDSFYLEYSPKLWRLAYRLTRNRYDSEDLVDEAFLIYLQKSTTMVIDNPEAYITRILANLVRNYARLSWHNELPIDVLPESTLSTDGVGMRLREVLPKGLSPQEQEILLLRFEERLSYSEIADVLKILYGSKDGKNFTVSKSYNYQDYPIMMSSGKHYYEDLFTYYGTVGYSYYVTAFCYAGDSTGYDEKPYTSIIVKAT